MHEWKSKRIQYRGLQRNRLIRVLLLISILFYQLRIFAQAQNTSNLPTIKESPIERIHALEILQVNGLSEKSIPEYIELLSFSETQELAHFRLATLYANLSNWPKAEIHAKSAIESNPNNSDYDYLLIQILEKQFQYEAAWEIHKKLINQQPRYISRYYDAISNCIKREDHSDALQLIKQYQFHFGSNEYAHRIQTQSYLYLDSKYPQQHYLDSLLIYNEQYLLSKPKEFTPWVSFHINQIQKNKGSAESKTEVVSFYQKMLDLQKHDSTILKELEKLTYEFPVLRNNLSKVTISQSYKKLSQLNKELSNQLIFNVFENQIQDTTVSLSELDSLLNTLTKTPNFGYKSEVMVLVGNQYFIRGEFEKAQICFQFWNQNEPTQSPFFTELTSPENKNTSTKIQINNNEIEDNSVVNTSKMIKNDLLSIHNRYIVCLYKSGNTSALKTALEWYEVNFPFITDDASQIVKIFELQLNKQWKEAVNLWNQFNPESPILNEVYFAQIDIELNLPGTLKLFKTFPIKNQVSQWQNQGKIHPTLARDLIKRINQTGTPTNK